MREGPRTEAVLLDALGTLLTLQPPAPLLRAALDQRVGLDVCPSAAEAAFSAEIRYYRAHLNEGRDGQSLTALRARCASVLREALLDAIPADRRGRDALATLSSDAMTELMLSCLRFRAFEDARPVLGRLRAAGIRLVVCSNWDVSLPQTLEHAGLLDLLDGVITSAQCGNPKPAPEIFRGALELAGVPASRAIHVGDRPTEDVAGARAAGVEPVLLVRDGPAPAIGAPVIRTLDELLDLAQLGLLSEEERGSSYPEGR